MKKIIPMLAAVTLLGLVGCNQPQGGGWDNATMNRRTDSAYAAQRQSILESEANACAANFQAKVNQKTDSIMAARGTR